MSDLTSLREITRERFMRRVSFCNQSPRTGRCEMCTEPCTERNLTRQFTVTFQVNIRTETFIDICPDCCRTLEVDTIADWPDSLMFARFDRMPFRPQDY